MLYDYDDNSIQSVMNYAKKLENMTYREILNLCKEYITESENGLVMNRPQEFVEELKNDKLIKNSNGKGQLGNFLEKYYFGYKPNSDQSADLKNIGVEIKQTPIDIKKDGTYAPGERLVITMIPFDQPIIKDFYQSHVYEKIRKILLVQYIRDKTKERLDYQIKYVNLFTPSETDLKIIIDDYNKINKKIMEGKAHELSESDTYYLGACTKGKTAKDSVRNQYYGNHIPAKKRAYCFKTKYMKHVLEEYVMNNKYQYESIVHDAKELDNISFEDLIISKINNFKNKTDRELCRLFNVEYKANKNLWSMISFRMLGIKGNQAEEFDKANIVVKAIRIGKNGKIKESMSFPYFKFKDFANEEWETSTIHEYFETTKFLFVVFEACEDGYKLAGAQLWNMPYNDLEITVKEGWEAIHNKIAKGINFHKASNRVENDLPKKADNKIIHIRPHAAKAAYKFSNGEIIGDINKNANELPDGQWMTTQSFWINNDYILSNIKKGIKL